MRSASGDYGERTESKWVHTTCTDAALGLSRREEVIEVREPSEGDEFVLTPN